MGIVVRVKTAAKPHHFICSWLRCEHDRDMECGRVGGPKMDDMNPFAVVNYIIRYQ